MEQEWRPFRHLHGAGAVTPPWSHGLILEHAERGLGNLPPAQRMLVVSGCIPSVTPGSEDLASAITAALSCSPWRHCPLCVPAQAASAEGSGALLGPVEMWGPPGQGQEGTPGYSG